MGNAPVLRDLTHKGVSYDASGAITRCMFCEIVNKAEGSSKIVFEDESVIAFLSIRPAATRHILVSPREHIRNLDVLTRGHIPLLNHMRHVGQQLMSADNDDNPADNVQFSFHVPPYNSIDHLHLHCIKLPFLAWKWRYVYWPGSYWCIDFDAVMVRLLALNVNNSK